MRRLEAILVALLFAARTVAASQELVHTLARKLAAQNVKAKTKLGQVPNLARIFTTAEPKQSKMRQLRRLDDSDMSCDAAFLGCLKEDACVECFVELEAKDIDWASVSSETPCSQVVQILNKKDHCTQLRKNFGGQEIFCKTFDSCVNWEDETDKQSDNKIKCQELKECKWDGMHEQWLGDGICHDKVDGCYNTEICGWDGGDCCEDTCKTAEFSYVDCGIEAYACKDPTSSKCLQSLNPLCTVPDKGKTSPPIATCKEGTMPYRMIMYDSFGDGWDGTKLEISDKASFNTILYNLDLKEGSQGTEYICLSKSPACYHVDVKGGGWGREVSWEVKPMTDGAPALGSGGSPMSCDFPVAGNSCTKTCNGRTTEDPAKDPDYKDFKTMTQCINDKCPVQIGACEADNVCVDCFKDIPADYCYADDYFNALLDCVICSCTDGSTEYCDTKNAPGSPSGNSNPDGYSQDPCSPAETVKGGNAVLTFGKCAEIDQASMMITDFDQNNFGMLDSFEACAHAFTNKPDRGGHTALQCLQILVNAKDGAFDGTTSAVKLAIQALASHLYDNPRSFCDCASRASTDCPLCPSFMNFKTLLYETLDACQSLDEIDCDAWSEFYPRCQKNLVTAKGSVDFNDASQCNYVQDGCGGAGAFPVFRRLDCVSEVSSEAWSFYELYSNVCLDGKAPAPTPPAPTPSVPSKTPAPAVPSSGDDDYIQPVSPSDKKPYVPPEDRDKDKKKSDASKKPGKEKKKSHFFRNVFWLAVIVGGAYYYYKNYGCDFAFLQRYRRFRPVATFDGGEMYSGLTMESSTSFQPPTLPPTPIDMGSGNNGGHFI